MDRLEIDDAEKTAISSLLDECEEQFRAQGPATFIDNAPILAHKLPRSLRSTINEFRLGRRSGLMVLGGHPMDQERIGPTPPHWRDAEELTSALREELLLVLYGSLLGDLFGWTTQQNGKLIHDVIPIRGHEEEQLGSSSTALLTWHTEDAFHPLRSDYLLFACLRNPYAAATTFGLIDDVVLSDKAKALLFEGRYVIQPDESHKPHHNTSGADFAAIEDMLNNPDRVAVLFGDPAQPYIRIDPYFMSIDDDDLEAKRAFEELTTALDDAMFDVNLQPGEYCIIDNHRVVHGRKPFTARHDGTDRWLKRISVTSDLRRSRAARQSLTSRLIH
jgi:Fe(II)/alpha-ketoglutarate-dependent arginine beta-hydroxylase